MNSCQTESVIVDNDFLDPGGDLMDFWLHGFPSTIHGFAMPRIIP